MFGLDGRVALITGASKSLGRSMAGGLVSAGADLLVCSRNAEEMEQPAKELRSRFHAEDPSIERPEPSTPGAPPA